MVEAEQSATDRAVEPISQQEEIERLTRTGLRIAGAVGLVLALALIAVYTLVFNLPIAWVGRRDISTAIWDEAAVALLGGLLIAAARSPRLVRSGRLLFALAVWLAGVVVLFDDAMHHGQLQSTGYLALLVLAAVGLMPYRRAEMLGIGAGLVVVATGLTLGLSLRLNPELLIFLGVLTILGAWISGALWESRTQRVEWLRMTAMSEERYRSLFRDASDAIFTIDNATGRFQEVNPALERLLGESSARLRQRQFHEIIHPEDRERVSGYHRARISGDEAPNHYQARIVAPTTGAIHFCEITIHRLSRPRLT
ncbi:MAG: PAS domain S-box protein, partial [candidate division Zixibacteria bacterium]|nr:PAS domain S-box protein [candidate division Zixibacteria bacterium]